MLSLVKRGYGTLEYIQDLDADDFLDIIEFEEINSSISYYEHAEANKRR